MIQFEISAELGSPQRDAVSPTYLLCSEKVENISCGQGITRIFNILIDRGRVSEAFRRLQTVECSRRFSDPLLRGKFIEIPFQISGSTVFDAPKVEKATASIAVAPTGRQLDFRRVGVVPIPNC
jgi:hypothetical protein